MMLPLMLLAALASVPIPSPPLPACEYGLAIGCVKVVRVYDGDTITVDLPGTHSLFGKSIGVRVRGIDAAEMHGHHPCEVERAKMARELVANALRKADNVRLTNLGRDKYFRILADVWADNQSIAELVVKAGLACPYDGGKKPAYNWCEADPCG